MGGNRGNIKAAASRGSALGDWRVSRAVPSFSMQRGFRNSQACSHADFYFLSERHVSKWSSCSTEDTGHLQTHDVNCRFRGELLVRPDNPPCSSKRQPTVLFESHSSLRKFTLNRPKKLNALDEPMLALLRPKIEVFQGVFILSL